MQFGVFNLVNIEKGRTRGSGHVKYIAAYEVTTRAGGKYQKYFYHGQEGRIGKFLASVAKRGGVAARIDTAAAVHHPVSIAPPPRPLPPLVVGEIEGLLAGRALPEQKEVSVATVEESKLQHQNDVRYKYVRLGDKLRSIDPAGWKQAKLLREMGVKIEAMRDQSSSASTSIAKLQQRGAKTGLPQLLEERAKLEGDLRSLTQARDKMLGEFTQRPLAMKLARMASVADESRALKEEGKKWIAENPEEWKLYLRRHKRKTAKLSKEGKTGYAALEFPPHIQEQLEALKWKKRGLSGEAHYIETHAPKLGVGENLKVTQSPELEGITPEHGAVSYILTSGTWSTKDPSGKNIFTLGTSAALYKEFAGTISNIASGRTFKPGWAKVFNLKDLAEDLKSHLKVKLLSEIAPEYTAARAEQGREMGKNFKAYAISKLNSEAQHFVRDALQHAVQQGTAEPEVLNEPSLHWHEEGEVTRDLLRQAGAPLASAYASPEDIIAVKDFRTLLSTKVGKMESIGLLSRFNLHNPVENPGGGKGRKSWDEVAEDVVTELAQQRGKEGVPSKAFVKQHLMRNLARVFAHPSERPAHEQTPKGWTFPMTPSEKVALKEGLTAFLRLAGGRSLPGASSWRVAKPPTKAGHGRHAKPGLSVPLVLHSDVHRVVSELPIPEPARVKVQKRRVKKGEDGVDVELAGLILKVSRLLRVE